MHACVSRRYDSVPDEIREVTALGLLGKGAEFMTGTDGRIISCVRYTSMTKDTARHLCARASLERCFSLAFTF